MKNLIVYFLKGLPGCGKTTWALQKIEESRQKGIVIKRVNKDDLRAMLDNSIFSKEREKYILKIRDSIIQSALLEGHSIIVDDTNFSNRHLESIKSIVKEMSISLKRKIELQEILFDTSLSECIKRDSKRENPVGRRIIIDMYDRYLRGTSVEILKYDKSLSDCIIVDLDGTLALHESRSPFDYFEALKDRPNIPIIKLMESIQIKHKPLTTIIVTGRENLTNEEGITVKDISKKWLKQHSIIFNEIFIRAKGDMRSDFIVKKEIFEKNIKNVYNVLYAIDDRRQVVDMWRDQGFSVLDVAGNEF